MHGCVNMQISNQNIAAICAKEGFDWIFWRIFVFLSGKRLYARYYSENHSG